MVYVTRTMAYLSYWKITKQTRPASVWKRVGSRRSETERERGKIHWRPS